MTAVDRRTLLAAGLGLYAAGGATGACVVNTLTAAAHGPAEGPTARTAVPHGAAARTATVTFRTAPASKLVALTLDDGPTRTWTPQVLALLHRHGARATFFRVGKRAQAEPDLVRQTAAEGHEQGNHTWAHDDLTQHDLTFDMSSLQRTHALLTGLTRQPPAWCRPPYGRIDSVGLAACAELRYGVVLWSEHVTGQYAATDVGTIVSRVSPGTIILAHDGGPEPNRALITQLDRLVVALSGKGYRFVTISELLA